MLDLVEEAKVGSDATVVRHFELAREFRLEFLHKSRIGSADEEIVDVDQDEDGHPIYPFNIDSGTRLKLPKAELDHDNREGFEPEERSLLESIKGFQETENILPSGSRRSVETFELLDVDFAIDFGIEEGGGNVHRVNVATELHTDRKEQAKHWHGYCGRVSLIIINPPLLSETSSYRTGLVSLKGPVRFVLLRKNPARVHHRLISRPKNHFRSTIVL